MGEWKRGEMCRSCAGRKGTDANQSPETMATLAECISTGEPFYCHESTAERDPNGLSSDRHGNRYRRLPFSRWRVCRAWTAAVKESLGAVDSLRQKSPESTVRGCPLFDHAPPHNAMAEEEK